MPLRRFIPLAVSLKAALMVVARLQVSSNVTERRTGPITIDHMDWEGVVALVTSRSCGWNVFGLCLGFHRPSER